MTKDEVKQWLRNQIDSSIKIQAKYNNCVYYLCYNNNYLRALKLSKITGAPVNKKDFNSGETLIAINIANKHFSFYEIIVDYLYDNYSKKYSDQRNIVEEVFNEYNEYKGYKVF